MSARKWGWGHDVSEATLVELGIEHEWHEWDGDEVCVAELRMGAVKDIWSLIARPYHDGVQLSLTLVSGSKTMVGSRLELLELVNMFNRESPHGAATIGDDGLFSWDEMLDLPRQLVEKRLRAICREILEYAIATIWRYADAVSAVTFGGVGRLDAKHLILPREGEDAPVAGGTLMDYLAPGEGGGDTSASGAGEV